jgi:hypothetical protein
MTAAGTASASAPAGTASASAGTATGRPAPTGTVSVLDSAQPGGDSCLASGYGLAVAAVVGAFGHVLAGPFDLAEVGLSFVGVGGDGEHGDVGGVVQDEADWTVPGILEALIPGRMQGHSGSTLMSCASAR